MCACMQVDLIGHSAGGWLGRAYLGDPKYFPVPPAAIDDSDDDSAPSASKKLTCEAAYNTHHTCSAGD